MLLQIDVSGLASVAFLLNSMALLIAASGAWLLLATRWRQQLAVNTSYLAGAIVQTVERARALATQRIDRFFYCFGLSSLGLAWLLSSLTRLV